MNNKVDAKEIDERIETQIWNRLILDACEISDGLLQDILIARNKKVLGLKNCEISHVYAEELQLDEEFANYNTEILDGSEVIVVQGKDKNGKNNRN